MNHPSKKTMETMVIPVPGPGRAPGKTTKNNEKQGEPMPYQHPALGEIRGKQGKQRKAIRSTLKNNKKHRKPLPY